MSSNLPIGVFDSGIGGLTVVKEIMNQLPGERIIYYGDTARVPYGSKSKETVTAYSKQITRFLLSKEVKAIVVACNTVSAVAMDALLAEVKVPLIGVVKPGARVAAETTKNGSIGIIGTETTVRSHVYNSFINSIDPKLQIFGKACPLFVPLVEEGWLNHHVTEEVVEHYLKDLMEKNIDTLVLGCTHYPLLRDVIQACVKDSITLVNPAYETAKVLKKCLEDNDILSSYQQVTDHTFYVSDGAEKFRSFANSILPCDIIETKDVNVMTFE